MTIASQLNYYRESITAAACNSRDIKLLAVSKMQSVEKIREAFQAGQTAFGENYLQEAMDKIKFLADLSIEWHFIGRIQRNKTRWIAENFSWVESVTSEIIIQRLADARPNYLPALNICLQVNMEEDPARVGIFPEQVIKLARFCQSFKNINLRGLMILPKAQKNELELREIFIKSKKLQTSLINQGIPLDTLSMGMTHDFIIAIEAGSTLIRIGTGIFGDRK